MRGKTSDESQGALDNVLWFLIEVEDVGSDVSVSGSLVEVAFDHLQERGSFAFLGEAVGRSADQVPHDARGNGFDHNELN